MATGMWPYIEKALKRGLALLEARLLELGEDNGDDNADHNEAAFDDVEPTSGKDKCNDRSADAKVDVNFAAAQDDCFGAVGVTLSVAAVADAFAIKKPLYSGAAEADTDQQDHANNGIYSPN